MWVALRSAVVWGPPAGGLRTFLVAVGGNCCVQVPYTNTCFFGAAVFQGTRVSTSVKGLRPWYLSVCFGSCACACFELALVTLCLQWSAVVPMRMALSCWL